MHLYYIANIRVPTEKAHGKQTREMCNALASLNVPVTLVVTNRKTKAAEGEFGLVPGVTVVRLSVPDTVAWGFFGFLYEYVRFAFAVRRFLRSRKSGAQVITREYLCAMAAARLGIPTIWESHRPQWNHFAKKALGRGARLVVVSKGLRDFYIEKGVRSEHILVAPAGVDVSRYQNLPTLADARRKLSLPFNTKIAMYNGHLYAEKGADTLAKAALLLPSNYLVVFMGGMDEDIEAYRKKYRGEGRISIIGRKDDHERPLYLRAADVVVLPNSAKEEITEKFGSPLKLFGYMASGTPIVASDLPSSREVLDESCAYFVEPDNSIALAEGILLAAEDSNAFVKGQEARRRASDNTWTMRARAILDFFPRGE